MPPLVRTSRRLLTKVQHKPHATQNDHHDVLPTPPATNSARSSGSQRKVTEDEEDLMRDPVSSEDEGVPSVPPFIQASNVGGAYGAEPQTAQFKTLGARSFNRSPAAQTATWKEPNRSSMRSPESTRSKRSNSSDEQARGDADIPIFSSQSSPKRQKLAAPNIHAPSRKSKGYGKKDRKPQSSSRKQFTTPTAVEKKAVDEPKRPEFQQAKGVKDMFEFRGNERPTFTMPYDTGDSSARNSLSPSLSSLSSVPDSPDVEEVAGFNLPAATPYCPTVNCDICGVNVDKLMKENFEDKLTHGKATSFKWQQRFCRHHREETAKQEWKERGYPEIDWERLESRMRRFDDHLRDVICDRVKSQWKHDLKRHMQPSKSKFREVRAATTSQEAKTTAWTGYYGPRGENAMTDHIVASLSDDLRERASKDRIVAAAGVEGGMSGFVRGVLVPELACQLIAGDMGIDPDACRVTVGESADVGRLLNPDVDDDVTGRRGGDGENEEMED